MIPIQSSIRALANREKSQVLSGFFKTAPGQYGEGDIFLGITVPQIRKLLQETLPNHNFEDAQVLLESPYHEERLFAVLLLVAWTQKGTFPLEKIAEFYMQHREYINNWDLVDLSSYQIMGRYMEECLDPIGRRKLTDMYTQSTHLWTNRIIILACFYQIQKGNEAPLFEVVPKFLSHPHDLIHKACGWMLREVGKRISEKKLCDFLDIYRREMPRTMLRYAIERMEPEKKAYYMKK